MIVKDIITINGTELMRTYSDAGYMVERDGVLYEEAIDSIDSGRVYAETTVPIDEGAVAIDEATAADHQAALREFGVSV